MIKKNKVDSIIISWSYDDKGDGIVTIGDKDPLGIEQRIRILEAFPGELGLKFLKNLGVEFSK